MDGCMHVTSVIYDVRMCISFPARPVPAFGPSKRANVFGYLSEVIKSFYLHLCCIIFCICCFFCIMHFVALFFVVLAKSSLIL